MSTRQKKKRAIVVLVLALALSVSFTDMHAATEIFWDGGGSDNYLTTPENWDGNVLPVLGADPVEHAILDIPGDQPLVAAGINASFDRVIVGQYNSGCTLDVTGGSLTSFSEHFTVGRKPGGSGVLNISKGDVIANEGFVLANHNTATGTINMSGGTLTVHAGSNEDWWRLHCIIGDKGLGTLNMSGGTLNIDRDMWLGKSNTSTGIVHMTTGTINVAGTIRLSKRATSGFYLDGGVVTAADLLMTNNNANLDIIDGVMILDGDKVSTVQEYIDQGLITGYGFQGAVIVDYNVTNADKTTLMMNPAFNSALQPESNLVTALTSNIQREGDDTAMAAIEKVFAGLNDGQDAAQTIYQLACAYRRLYQYGKSCEVHRYIADTWPQGEHVVYSLNNMVVSGIKNNNIEEAEAAAKKLLKNYPDNPWSIWAIRLLADKYRNLQKFAEARELYQNIVATWPENESAIISQKGIVYANLGLMDVIAAENAYNELLTNYSQHKNIAQIVSDVANEYRRSGKYVKARDIYQYVADTWPSTKVAMLANVVTLELKLYRYEEAEVAAKKLMTEYVGHPESMQAIRLIARLYRKLQRSAEACEFYQYIVTTWPDDEHTISSCGNIVLCKIGMGDEVATNAAFEKLVTDFYDDERIVRVVNSVALEYYNRQRYRKAWDVYRYVLENWPENKSAIISQKGIVWASLGLRDFIAAENAYDELLTNYSQHKNIAQIVSDVANGYRRSGKHVKARDIYQYVADTWPDSKMVMLAQGKVVFLNTQIGDETAAKISMEKLLTQYYQHKDIAQIVADIANEYYRFKKYVNARDLYQYIIDTWPTSEPALLAHRNAAIASLRMGDDIVVNSAVEKAITGFSHDNRLAGMVNEVARQYQILGKYSQAHSLYKRVIENWPDDKEAIHSYMGLILANIGMGNDKVADEAIEAFISDFSFREDITRWIIWMASESRCEMKKYDQARKLYQIVLEQWPDNKRVMRAQMGIVCIDVGCKNYEAAEAGITKLFTDISNHEELPEDIKRLIGNFRFTEGLSQAHELYFAHKTWWSDNEYVSYISHIEVPLVELCFQLGNENTVQTAIAYLLTVDFTKVRYGHIYRMARECDRLNQHDGAYQLYQKVIDTWPHTKYAIKSLVDLAILHSRLGNDTSSEESIVKLISGYSDYPGFPKLVFRTATGYYEEFQKQKTAGYEEQAGVCLEMAQKVLEIVVDRLPKFGLSNEATLHLADCHRLLGHSEQALAYYQKVVDEYPDFEYAWNAHFQIGNMNYRLKLKNIIPSQIANPIIIREFETILEKYPDSPVARTASQWLQENVY